MFPSISLIYGMFSAPGFSAVFDPQSVLSPGANVIIYRSNAHTLHHVTRVILKLATDNDRISPLFLDQACPAEAKENNDQFS
jgi:hypothetical protein